MLDILTNIIRTTYIQSLLSAYCYNGFYYYYTCQMYYTIINVVPNILYSSKYRNLCSIYLI